MFDFPSIIVLEDEEDDFFIVQTYLEEAFEKIEIVHYAEPPSADFLLKTHNADVILVDYRMGKINGIDLIAELRSKDPAIGLILLTGMPTKMLDVKASEIGACDFLSKSDLTMEMLERSIRFTVQTVRQKRQLQAQAEQIESILRPTRMALWSLGNPIRNDLFYTESIFDLTGYTKAELESGEVKWIDLVEPYDAEIAENLKDRIIKESSASGRYRIRRKDGKLVWIDEELHSKSAASGKDLVWIEGSLHDVTNRYENESQLNLLASTLEYAGDGILITDADLDQPGPRIVYINRAMEEMTGYNRYALIGKSPRILQGPESNREVLSYLRRCLVDHTDFRGATINYRKDGSKYWVNWGIRPLVDDSGKVTHFISVQRDVTEEHLQRKKLQYNEEFLREMGRSGNIGGWRYRIKPDTMVWTDQVYSIHKLDTKTKINLERTLNYYPDEYRQILSDSMDDCLKTGKSFNLELPFKDENGNKLWVLNKGEAQIENDTIVGAWGVLQDISELKKKEIILHEALEKAEIANVTKDQFLMVSSHELRTPLNPIMGFADLLASELEDEEQIQMAKMIGESAKHLTSLVDDILDLASIESGKMKLNLAPLNLVEKLQFVVETLSYKATQGQVELRLSDNEELRQLEKILIISDEKKIQQILLNLVGNAIKFSPKGKVDIAVKKVEKLADNKLSLILTVKDNGIGIPENEFEKIFERFHQVSMRSTRNFGGQGLGLAICRQLAHLLNGHVSVQSNEGEGSTFQFEFQAEIESEDACDESAEKPLTCNKRSKILLVEDHKMSQHVFRSFLRHEDMSCDIANNGKEAIEYASTKAYDLILMDLQMPIVSGMEAFMAIRSGTGPNTKTPVIALSAHTEKSVIDKCLAMGMAGFHEKPFTYKSFLKMLYHHGLRVGLTNQTTSIND